jgi:hypothetical protein
MTKKGRNRIKSLNSLSALKPIAESTPIPTFTRGLLLSDDYPVFGDYIYLADDKPIRSDIFGNVAKLKQDLTEQGIKFNNIYSAIWEFNNTTKEVRK